MSTLISEATAKRIADELKRLADILDRQNQTMPRYHFGQPIPGYDPNRCGVCGGYHPTHRHGSAASSLGGRNE